MSKRVTIAEAKNHLPSLVHEAEREPIELTRRGKPVAVLLSRQAYERLQRGRQDPWESLETFRSSHDLTALHLAAALDQVRDKGRARGRPFRW